MKTIAFLVIVIVLTLVFCFRAQIIATVTLSRPVISVTTIQIHRDSINTYQYNAKENLKLESEE